MSDLASVAANRSSSLEDDASFNDNMWDGLLQPAGTIWMGRCVCDWSFSQSFRTHNVKYLQVCHLEGEQVLTSHCIPFLPVVILCHDPSLAGRSFHYPRLVQIHPAQAT